MPSECTSVAGGEAASSDAVGLRPELGLAGDFGEPCTLSRECVWRSPLEDFKEEKKVRASKLRCETLFL